MTFTLEEKILALLEKRELSATQIMKELKLNVATTYITLIRMEDHGLVTSRFVDGMYPRLRVYKSND